MTRYKHRGRDATWGRSPDSSGLTREEREDLATEGNRSQTAQEDRKKTGNGQTTSANRRTANQS